jgi:hypothetical protein
MGTGAGRASQESARGKGGNITKRGINVGIFLTFQLHF